jgi:acetyltransferase-like isoleucine patch superfamily enzyme
MNYLFITTILCDVTMSENAIVGAGGLVTKGVFPNTVVVGNPVNIMKRLDK